MLQPTPAAATFDASLDDDAPTLVAARNDLDDGFHWPDVATQAEPPAEAAARAVPAADVLSGFAVDLDVCRTATERDEVAVEPPPWWEAASVAVAAPPPSTTPWTGHFEAFPEQPAPADAPAAGTAPEPGSTGGAKPWWELTEVEATTTTDAEAGDVSGPSHADEVAQARPDVEPAARDGDPAEPTPVVAASVATESGEPLSGFETQEDVIDAPPAAEPRPWWEVAEVTAASPMPAMEAPAGDPAQAGEPLTAALESDAAVASADADAVARHPQVQAHRVADVPRTPETPRRAPEAPVRPPRPRPARPPRPAVRTRRASVGRLLSVALGSALLCIVAMLGFPDLFDLTWNAPAPVSSPPSPEPLAAPLPAAPALPADSATPSTPSAPAASTPSPAAEAPKPAPAASPVSSASPARPKARPDTAAASRAARLLQQRAAAAQARPGAVTPPPAERPAELPRPAIVETPAALAPAAEAEPAAEPLGSTFEVTQVDVRPQVTRQVTPRRPDGRTSAEVVVVRVLVSPSGRAADVRVVRGARDAPSYNDAAVAAVRQWTFSPAQKRSRPVSCWIHVGVPFAGGE